MDIKRELEVMKEVDAANKRHVEEWKAETMLAVYVDVYGEKKVSRMRISRDSDEWHKLLKCQTLDMPFRFIGGRQFVIICNDEELYREGCRPSAANGDEIILFGNLLVVAFDGHEDIRGLTEDEADHVMRHVATIQEITDGTAESRQVLMDVTFDA